MNRAEIISLFHKRISKKYESGCECIFVKLNKEIGLKLYSSKKERNHAFLLQKKAFEHELSPPVFGRLSIPGFVIIVTEFDYADIIPLTKGKIYGYTTGLANKPRVGSTLDHRIDILEEKLTAAGLCWYDLHDENVGYYKNKLVAIDFGPVSMD
ncbi:MAG: hypothetical protein ACKVQA_26220, partial [Burkholderiales bacterium]